MKRIPVIITLLLCLALAGCTFSSGAGHTWNGDMAYTFNVYNSDDSQGFDVKAGQTIHIDYAAECEGGDLSLRLIDPEDQTVWEVSVGGSQDDGSQDVKAESDGRYVMQVKGEDAVNGNYDLKWTVE
ncbi:MAG TPA: hypothetical protein VHO48_05265 [Anaerolineaceae bacterium]|nr:hypothetical protein [Anaerolineaceae bacterium]